MAITTGTDAVSVAVGGYPSRVSLQAEVARYQKELAECVSCPSSKTQVGKANIQALSNKISADQSTIQRIEARKAVNDDVSSTSTEPVVGGGLLNVFA